MNSVKSVIGQRIASATVAFTHNHFGIRSFELELRDGDGKRLGTYIVPLNFLKAEGITHTLHARRKVEAWANSEKGLEWLRENYGTDATHIAKLGEHVRAKRHRRKLPSLTEAEVRDFLQKDVNVFHNGGLRQRIVVGWWPLVGYKTKTNALHIYAEPMEKFAAWCKGAILPDGTVWTKGDHLSDGDGIGESKEEEKERKA